jgi:hypothetical protein
MAPEAGIDLAGSTSTDSVADLNTANTGKLVENLTTTDLISRQLFGDYFNLASTGGINEKSINSLAEAYADGIAKMAQTSHILAVDLNIVSDSEANLAAYRAWFAETIQAYQTLIGEEFAEADDVETAGPGLTKLGTRVSALYKKEADEFKAKAVPQSLITDHLALTNNYSGNAIAFAGLTKASSDPIEAVASLATIQQNSAAETLLIENIAKKLDASAIISPSQ